MTTQDMILQKPLDAQVATWEPILVERDGVMELHFELKSSQPLVNHALEQYAHRTYAYILATKS